MPLFSKKKTDAAETTVEPGQEEWRNWKPSNEKGVEESTRHTEVSSILSLNLHNMVLKLFPFDYCNTD